MNKDKFQDKYQEIFQEMKEEKMDWDFEDFLQKTEENSAAEKIVPIQKNGGGNTKWFWMAASVVLLLGFGMFFKNTTEKTNVEPSIVSRNTSSVERDASKSVVENVGTVSVTRKIDVEPAKKKKSRYRNNAQYLAKNTVKHHHKSARNDEGVIEYNPNFVIINGKPVATEEEAISYTKTALDMLGGNINSALENAEPVKLLTVNF
jgi:hypothetical protein